jgi:catechol 2,3-dioxygenase-like lactoylglutathione lyase family enzyme
VAIKDIFHINVNCTDLDRSRAFYELVGFQAVVELGEGGSADMLRGLGLPAGVEPPVLMMLEPDKPAASDRPHPVDQRRRTERPPTISRTPAVRRAVDHRLDPQGQLRAAGGEFVSDVVAMPDGTSFCCFKDPDGMVLELIDFSTARRSSSPRL